MKYISGLETAESYGGNFNTAVTNLGREGKAWCKMRKKVVAALVGILLLGSVLEVYASSTAEQIEEREDEIKEIKGELKGANEELDFLEGAKEVLEVERDAYENSIEEIIAEIGILNDKIEELEIAISETESYLEAAKKEEQSQYRSMKKRIQYMYERGNTNFFEIMLSSRNMGEALSKIEYVENITKYDRVMLDKYSGVRKEVEEKQELLSVQQQELEVARITLREQQEEMAVQLAVAKENLSEYEDKIFAAEIVALEYEEKLRRKQESLEGVKRRQAEEEAYAQKAEGSTSNTSGIPLGSPPSTVTTATELQLLAAIIECEAGGESYTGKIAVGNVVMNRIASSRFPNNMVDVLYQKSQFTPVTSGRFVLVLSRGANAACTEAAQAVLNGEKAVGDHILFFHRYRGNEEGLIIGNHIFK